MQFDVRRPRDDEHERVRSMVSDVVNETYGSMWPTKPIDVGEEEWGAGWVAVAADDLWVASRFRRHRIGSALLLHGEKEIAARHLDGASARDRFQSAGNRLLRKRGWCRLRETPHEIAAAPRLETTKTIG